jgi:2TM domain-containing protein
MSHYHENAPQGRDPYLWGIAKRRAGFKYHLTSYIVVISALWLVWYFTTEDSTNYMWPVWPTLGWGIGLTFHFLGAYVFPASNSVEREYEKLARDRR